MTPPPWDELDLVTQTAAMPAALTAPGWRQVYSNMTKLLRARSRLYRRWSMRKQCCKMLQHNDSANIFKIFKINCVNFADFTLNQSTVSDASLSSCDAEKDARSACAPAASSGSLSSPQTQNSMVDAPWHGYLAEKMTKLPQRLRFSREAATFWRTRV